MSKFMTWSTLKGRQVSMNLIDSMMLRRSSCGPSVDIVKPCLRLCIVNTPSHHSTPLHYHIACSLLLVEVDSRYSPASVCDITHSCRREEVKGHVGQQEIGQTCPCDTSSTDQNSSAAEPSGAVTVNLIHVLWEI